MRFGEFVPLAALMISLVALSIDAMLPALPAIGSDELATLSVVRYKLLDSTIAWEARQ